MSYYTYFKPAPSFIDGYDEKILKENEDVFSSEKREAKSVLVLGCIESYYRFQKMLSTDSKDKSEESLVYPKHTRMMFVLKDFYAFIKTLVGQYSWAVQNLELNYLRQRTLEDEKHELYFNHFRKDEYDLQYTIDKFKESIEDCVLDLCVKCLTTFEADTKYLDTPKTTAEYIQSEFKQKIDDVLNYIDQLCEDYEVADVLIKCYDSRQSEDDLCEYNEEESTEDGEKILSGEPNDNKIPSWKNPSEVPPREVAPSIKEE